MSYNINNIPISNQMNMFTEIKINAYNKAEMPMPIAVKLENSQLMGPQTKTLKDPPLFFLMTNDKNISSSPISRLKDKMLLMLLA